MGADDYMSKPFNPRELLARIRSVLRRCAADKSSSQEVKSSRLEFGPFELDIDTHKLSRDSQDISITTGEFTLLKTFLENPNRVMNRDALMKRSKGYEHQPLDRSIDMSVGCLRRIIEDDPSEPARGAYITYIDRSLPDGHYRD
jgi:two-component system phosphate regulon response regulator OmpR